MRGAVLLHGVLLGVCITAQADPVSDSQAARLAQERQQLDEARAVIESAYAMQQRECWQRFAVNDCLREARRQRHAALDPLRAKSLQLNAQERLLRTRQREARLGLTPAAPTPP